MKLSTLLSSSLKSAAVIAMTLTLSTISFAHTALVESTPADGATINTPPASTSLVFTEEVKLVKFQVMGTGHEMSTEFKPSTAASDTFTVVTPGMHPGPFTINWSVIGSDGHAVNGSIAFVVDPSAGESSAAASESESHSHGDAAAHSH